MRLRILLTSSNWPALSPLLASLVLLGGCGVGDGITLPGDAEPAGISVLNGDEQQGRVGEPLNEPLVVQVTDTKGRAVRGATVAFELTSAGADVVPHEKSTDANGMADARLVLGTTVGRQTGKARVVTQDGRPPVQADFSAIALSENANSMAAVAGQDQSGHVGTQLDARLVVRVTDGFGNPVAGVPISWVAEGGGSVSDALVATDQDGRSAVERTLGPIVGQQTTVASAQGLAGSPVTFLHTAVAGNASRLVVVSGNGQTATVGSELSADLVVRLVDAEGNGVPATAVSWVVATGGGHANPENSTTDDGGRTSARWTLGEAVGEQRVDAVVSGVGVASFRATATSRVIGTTTTITGDSPDPSVANTAFPVEFRVTSAGATPTGTVTVTVSGGPATCTGTLSGGVGSCSLTLGGLGARTLTATYSGAPGLSGSSDTEPHTVVSPPPQNKAPTAEFDVACSDLTCTFTDRSSDQDGSIVSRSWNYGDGTSGAQPSRTYAAAGTYHVTLTVTDNGGAVDSKTHDAKPKAPPPQNQPPTAAFTSNCVNLTCSFNSDGSSDSDGNVAGWNWTFGDGTNSTQRNPSHTYAPGGPYTVTLTVRDNDGAQSAPVSHTVTVIAPNQRPTAEFTWSCTNLDCQFTDQSSDPDGTIANWSWDFDDGQFSTDQNPAHSFGVAGTYKVRLTVTDNRGESRAIDHDVKVTAPPPPNQAPTADFSASCDASLTCSFTDGSTDPDGDGTIATWSWDFGATASPTSSSDKNPSGIVYPTADTYPVTLTVTDNEGATGTITQDVVVP